MGFDNLMERVLVKILEVIYKATVVDQDDNGLKDFKNKLNDSLFLRLGVKERYSIATLLDPR